MNFLLITFILSLISNIALGISIINNSSSQITFSINQSNNFELCESSIIEQQSGVIPPQEKTVLLNNADKQTTKSCIIINNNLISLFLWDIRCIISIEDNAKKLSLNEFCKIKESHETV